MKVFFEPAARDELEAIYRWVARENPRAASKLIDRIEHKILRLELPELAHMGRPGLVPGTREVVEFPYIVVYEVREADGEIAILSVVHGARNRNAT